jgi:hypothetical protein
MPLTMMIFPFNLYLIYKYPVITPNSSIISWLYS